MTPSEVDFELLWGLIYLNLKVRSQTIARWVAWHADAY
jgi:hypothetical protein